MANQNEMIQTTNMVIMGPRNFKDCPKFFPSLISWSVKMLPSQLAYIAMIADRQLKGSTL